MKNRKILIVLFTFLMICLCGCGKKYTYEIPVGVYMFESLDGISDEDFAGYIYKLNLANASDIQSGLVDKAKYNEETKMVELTYTEEQRQKKIDTLENYAKDGDGLYSLFSNDFRITGISESYTSSRVNVKDKETLERADGLIDTHVGCLMQLQILSGTSPKDVAVVVEVTFEDGTMEPYRFTVEDY